MCGILGVWHINGENVRLDSFCAGLQRIAHRGPDDDGLYIWNAHTEKSWLGSADNVLAEGSLAIGHRRLAIIDLEGGSQPLSNNNETLWITFNGEIYNYIELAQELRHYPFKTRSDTEVIIYAYEEWGEKCVQHLNGIFAFVLWDQEHQQLFAARDHLGVKPLYYTLQNGIFLFSSEIKALLAYPSIEVAPNWSAIAQYWQQGYVSGSDTFFKNIHKLPPAHTLTFDRSGQVHIERYWFLPPDVNLDTTFDEASGQLEVLLNDIIRLQMRSDVEVGAHLSGGIDSSLIVALATQHSGQTLHTFTGAWSSQNNLYDERAYAQLVAQRWKTHHHEIIISDQLNNDYVASLHKLIWYMDEPSAGPGLIPQYWVSKLCSQYVKVVLGGQGGDELFGGYRAFLPRILHTQLNALRVQPNSKTMVQLLRTLFTFASWLKPYEIFRAVNRRLQGDRIDWLIPEVRIAPVQDRNHPKHDGGLSPIDQIMRDTLTEYLVSLLHVEDRTSMAASVESRVPLLDYRLVEMAVQLPYTLKIQDNMTKMLIRTVASKHIPAQILQRKDKIGFSAPKDFWFGSSMKQLFENALNDSAPRFLQASAKAHLAQAYGKQDMSFATYTWRLVNVHLWLKTFEQEEGMRV